MPEFNAKAARAKRPFPIWVDAFQRDTQHLEADEIGAYFLLLMAMWTRESCDLPDDDMRLARVARVSLTLWKRRIGPVIREFFHADDGVIFQKRLRKEATFVEHGVELQSSRKKGKSSDKSLENIEVDQSTDITTDQTADNPTQQPNNPTLKKAATQLSAQPQARDAKSEEGSWTPDQLLDAVMQAVGLSIRGKIPTYWVPPASTMHVERWRSELGLSQQEILSVARENRKQHDDAPNGPKALDGAMKRLAEAKNAPIGSGSGRGPAVDPLDAMFKKYGMA